MLLVSPWVRRLFLFSGRCAIVLALVFVMPRAVAAADRYWVGADAGATGLWNDASNWAATSGGAGGAGVPGGEDDVYFDGGGGKVGGVVIDADVNVASITATSGYTGANANDGHIDNATNDRAVTVSGNATLDNKQVSMGDTSWSVAGNWDSLHVTTFNRNISHLLLTGSGKTILLGTSANNRLNILTVSGAVTTAGGFNVNTLIVGGTLTINHTIGGQQLTTSTQVTGTGTIKGSSTLITRGVSSFSASGSISVSSLLLRLGGTIAAGTYESPTVTINHYLSWDTTATFGSGSVVFTGNVTFSNTSTGIFSINTATYNPTIEFRGNVSFSNTGGGSILWQKGTGTITCSGTANQTIDLDGETVEDVEIDKAGGTVTFTDSFTADSFIVTRGTVDFNGQAITTVGDFTIGTDGNVTASGLPGSVLTVGGNFSADGSDGDLLTLNSSAVWYLTVSGTGVGSYLNVAYSDASGGAEINCATGCVNSGNNVHWNITDANPPYVVGLTPLNDATGVPVASDLIITFNKNVVPQAGPDNDIVIKNAADDSTIETIDAQSSQVTGSGTDTITIAPSLPLPGAQAVYVLVGADAFDDTAGNSFAGIVDTTTWNFTAAEDEPPTVPANLVLRVISGSQIDLSWDAATDNIGVTGYRIYRDGLEIATSVTSSYSDTTLSSSTSYTYRVSAYDASGNESAQSDPMTGSTTAANVVNVWSCGYLDRANTAYEVQQNLSSSGTCLAIIAQNVTLDLNDYTITYDNAEPITVYNGEFEIGDEGSPATASGWSFANAPDMERAAGTYVSPVSVASGSYAIRMPFTATDQYIVSGQPVTLQPNTTYTLSAKFYNNKNFNCGGGQLGSDITLYVGFEGTEIRATTKGFTCRGFQYQSVSFTTGASPETYTIEAGILSDGVEQEGYVYIDSIRVQRYRLHGIAVGPGWQTEEYPGLLTGNANGSVIGSGVIIQGKGHAEDSNAISIAANNRNIDLGHLHLHVHGANARNIEIHEGVNNVTIHDNILTSRVMDIKSRDAGDGAMVAISGNAGSGFEVYGNTFEDGPQLGIKGKGDATDIHDNTFALKTRYTNDFAIAGGRNIYNNVINCGTGDYSCRGIMANTGSTIYNNTVTVQQLPRNQEYNGCQAYGAYGLQIEVASNVEAYGNTIRVHGGTCGGAAFRNNPTCREAYCGGEGVVGMNNHVHDNTFVADSAIGIRMGALAAADSLVFQNNTVISDQSWVFVDGELSLVAFQGTMFTASGALSNPLRTYYGSTRDIRFIDNRYPDAETALLFTNASFASSGGVPNVDSTYFYDWTLTYTVNDSNGDPVSGATVTLTDSGSTVVHTGTTNGSGTGSGVVPEFRNASGSLTQYNPYLVTASYDGVTATGSVTMEEPSSITLTFGGGGSLPPLIESVSATAGSDSGEVTWATDTAASTRVHYGLTEALGSLTAEVDTSPRVTSHSATLSGLAPCATYYYRPVSRTSGGATGTGSTQSFTTEGCTNGAAVSAQTGSMIRTADGGSLSLVAGGTGPALTVPAGFAANDAVFQIKRLSKSTVLAAANSPSGKTAMGNHIYDLRAISGATVVTSFDDSITVSITYADGDITGYDESTLRIYRFDGSKWSQLSNCSVSTTAKAVTCSTTAFSAFGLFGGTSSGASDTSTTDTSTTISVQTQGSGGRRGSPAVMAQRIAEAHEYILARYEGTPLNTGMSEEEEPDDGMKPTPSRPTITRRRGRVLAHIDDQEVLFRDVEAEAWYAPYIVALVEGGIAQGYKDDVGNLTGEFGVANPITHAEVLKMALEAAGESIRGLAPSRNRTARGSWAEAYVARAEDMNLSLFSTTLDVHSPATRGQVIQTILEVMDIPIGVRPGDYRDLRASHPHANAIGTATWYGLIQGDTDHNGASLGTVRPDDHINRAEVAKIVAIVKEISQ